MLSHDSSKTPWESENLEKTKEKQGFWLPAMGSWWRLGGILGASWGRLGGVLGRLVGVLGVSCVCLGLVLGSSWVSWERLRGVLGRLGASRGGSVLFFYLIFCFF